jgi:hypothetical protein
MFNVYKNQQSRHTGSRNLRSSKALPTIWGTYMAFVTKYHWPISKDKNVMARTRKYYLKNNYLTLTFEVKVPQRSLQYATHRLMVMHPHTKYNWPSCTVMTFVGLWPLTSRSNSCFLDSIYLVCGCMTIRRCIAYRNALRGPWPLTEKQKCYYGLDKKILFKIQLFDLEVKGQGLTKVIMVNDLRETLTFDPKVK